MKRIRIYRCHTCDKILNAESAMFLVHKSSNMERKTLITRNALVKRLNKSNRRNSTGYPFTYSKDDIYCNEDCYTVQKVLKRMDIHDHCMPFAA